MAPHGQSVANQEALVADQALVNVVEFAVQLLSVALNSRTCSGTSAKNGPIMAWTSEPMKLRATNRK